jgi:hypothetical protein
MSDPVWEAGGLLPVMKSSSPFSTSAIFPALTDGLHIGLSTAGLEVNLVDISMHDFRQWTVHSGITPSLQALDEFAAHVSLFRLNPGLPVESCPTDDWNDEGREIDSRGRSFRIPIAPVLYSDWLKSLESLELCFPNASIDLYAQFLMESWSSVS